MPRLMESHSWNILSRVPARYFRLVKEALSLRQKIVVMRQAIHFLRRCLHHRIIPNFIANMRIEKICGLPEGSQRVKMLGQYILNISLKSKRDQFYACLKKCIAKEMCCQRYLPRPLWETIVGESKEVCDFIRSRVKTRLRERFNRLREVYRRQISSVQDVNGPHNMDRTFDDNHHHHTEQSRVTVIGDTALSNSALSILQMGPSFASAQSISPTVARTVVANLHSLHDRLRQQANRAQRGEGPADVAQGRFLVIPFPHTYYCPQAPNPSVDVKFRILATSTFKVLRHYMNKKPAHNISIIQREGLFEIKKHIAKGDVRVSVSDKGGDFVVLPRSLNRKITQPHLQDATLYCESSPKEYARQFRRLNKIWTETAQQANLPKSFINRLRNDHPVCPVLYTLIKTHKISASDLASNDPAKSKVRPIISSIKGPTDRVSWLLSTILVQLLKYNLAHLDSTNMLPDRLRRVSLRQDYIMESFDVTSLYTNVSNNAALEAIFELLLEHQSSLNLHGFIVSQLMTILGECLKCIVFKWSGQYFKQVRGLAMGQRLAPVLAITFMSKIEAPVLARSPVFFYRYIDDCIIICSTQTKMDVCFDLSNGQSSYIKFTLQKPKGGWLPFLNIQMRLVDKRLETKWYRKPGSKNILVHETSAHPRNTKQAVISNMFSTAKRLASTVALQKESLHIAHKIASANAYANTDAGGRNRWNRTSRKASERTEDHRVTLCLPFICDDMSRAIRACLREADLRDEVRLVDIPPKSLKCQLVRNRINDNICETSDCNICPFGKEGDCKKSGVVYVIRCLDCADEYIGETGRPLSIRIREHVDGLTKSRPNTRLGSHRIRRHNGSEFMISVSILTVESDTLARKTLEGCWIKARDPGMNRKDECIAVTNELAPFLDLCGLLPNTRSRGSR